MIAEPFGSRSRQGSSLAARVPWPRPRYLVTAAGCLALVGAAFAVAVTGADRREAPPFAQLWLIPGERDRYQVGVSSYTDESDTYRVEIEVDGRPVCGWRSLELSSGQRWTAGLRLRAGASARANLFRNGARVPYRTVYIRDANGASTGPSVCGGPNAHNRTATVRR
jgi:hypothetical protein